MRRLLIVFLFATASALAAESHALLIGIGTYKIKPLTGPPNDVAALCMLLTGKYRYKPEFVHTVVDQQATKQGILEAMRQLVAEVKPGDYVFFYYSGHGTSFYDKANRLKQVIGGDTSASLPVDFDASSLEAFGRSVLLGSELRPYFTQLDQKAQVFAVYDSCYSQDAMKALTRGMPKYVPLSQVVQGTAKGDLDDLEQGAANAGADDSNIPLPYRHMIAISAAKRDQAAMDISAEDVKRNPNATLDAKPHGQLTNAILIGLRGAADKNHDGTVTHEELFNYINEVSAGKWSHNPKLRVSADKGENLPQPVLTGKKIELDTSCSQGPWRQPRVSAPADLLRELGTGFAAVNEDWDVKVVSQHGGYLLYDAGGIQMNDALMTRAQTLARLQVEPVLEQLSELHYCRQTFNIELSIDPDSAKYVNSQKIQFSAKVDREAYVLVIDIDQEGGVTVNYPLSEATPLKVGKKIPLGKANGVTEPFGVDLIKAFAFETKPAGFDRFVSKSTPIYLRPGDPAVRDLLKMLVTDAADRSETKLRLITSKE